MLLLLQYKYDNAYNSDCLITSYIGYSGNREKEIVFQWLADVRILSPWSTDRRDDSLCKAKPFISSHVLRKAVTERCAWIRRKKIQTGGKGNESICDG